MREMREILSNNESPEQTQSHTCIRRKEIGVADSFVKYIILRPYFFLILGLQIFFQNINVGGGKKIKLKITKKKFFLFNLKHIWIGEKKITKIV